MQRTESGMTQMPVSVLLVEDEILISHLVADVLTEHGFEVHEAANADEALRYLDGGGAVDVMFTDVNLPGSMDGARLAQQARERRPELPIVYASGRHGASELGRMVTRSVFVPKPYRPRDVCVLLTRLTVR